MNFSEIADIVGKRVGLIQDRDITACKAFAKMRYDQLWRSYLWKDSLCEFLYTCDPSITYTNSSNFLPTRGILIVPSIIGQVIAARTDKNKLNVERQMVFYRVDQDQFANTGMPLDFMQLSSAVWSFDSAVSLQAVCNNAADVSQAITVDTACADGVSVARNSVSLTTEGTIFVSTDGILNVVKPKTTGSVTINAITFGNNLIPDGTSRGSVAPKWGFSIEVSGFTIGNSYQFTLGSNDGSLSAMPASQQGAAISSGIFVATQTSYYINGGLPNTLVNSTIYPVSITPIIILQPSQITALKCQRIQFVYKPDTKYVMRVLGKRITPEREDTDCPAVNGMDGILMELACYDMLLRDERGGTQESKDAISFAGELKAMLVQEETVQAAFNSRIMPECGFGGDDYFGATWNTKTSPY